MSEANEPITVESMKQLFYESFAKAYKHLAKPAEKILGKESLKFSCGPRPAL